MGVARSYTALFVIQLIPPGVVVEWIERMQALVRKVGSSNPSRMQQKTGLYN